MNRRIFGGSLFGFLSSVNSKTTDNIVKIIEHDKITYYSVIDGFHVVHREDGPAVEYANGDKE